MTAALNSVLLQNTDRPLLLPSLSPSLREIRGKTRSMGPTLVGVGWRGKEPPLSLILFILWDASLEPRSGSAQSYGQLSLQGTVEGVTTGQQLYRETVISCFTQGGSGHSLDPASQSPHPRNANFQGEKIHSQDNIFYFLKTTLFSEVFLH